MPRAAVADFAERRQIGPRVPRHSPPLPRRPPRSPPPGRRPSPARPSRSVRSSARWSTRVSRWPRPCPWRRCPRPWCPWCPWWQGHRACLGQCFGRRLGRRRTQRQRRPHGVRRRRSCTRSGRALRPPRRRHSRYRRRRSPPRARAPYAHRRQLRPSVWRLPPGHGPGRACGPLSCARSLARPPPPHHCASLRWRRRQLPQPPPPLRVVQPLALPTPSHRPIGHCHHPHRRCHHPLQRRPLAASACLRQVRLPYLELRLPC